MLRRVQTSTAILPLSCFGGIVTLQQRRWQVKEESTAAGRAHRSSRAYRNPLAARDPSARNVTLPDRAPSSITRLDRIPAEAQQKRAQKALSLQMQQRVLWEGVVVDNESHELIQHFLKLRTNPQYRDTKRLLVVSGKEQLRELTERGYTPHNMLIPANEEVPEWVNRNRTQIVRAERNVLDLADPGTDGFIGDFTIPEPPPKEELIANVHRMKNILVLDNVADSGTLGTLLRTAAGFAYDAVFTINHCADMYSHSVVRAARGAHFQKMTPFYTLREEDGDDAWAMINHVVERNKMQPVVFSPKALPSAPQSNSSSATGVEGTNTATDEKPSTSTAAAPSGAKRLAMSLHQYCMDSYLGRGPSTTTDSQRTSHMIIASDDAAQSLQRRLKKLRTAPVTLTLDAPSADLVTTLPTVMYQLRSSATWDYLPAAARTEASTMELQTRKMTPELGTLRDDVHLKPNLDEEEQLELASRKMYHRKAKRLSKYKRSDISYYADAEKERIIAMAGREKELLQNPLQRLAEDYKPKQRARGMPDYIPNLKHELSVQMGRDELREEAEAAESRRKTTLYDKQLHRGTRRPQGFTKV